MGAVFDFKPYQHKRAWEEILLPLYFTDGGRDIKQTLFAGNEPIFPSAKKLLDDPIVKEQSLHEIWKVRQATFFLCHCECTAWYRHENRSLTTSQLNLARDAYRTEYLQKWAESAKSSADGETMDVLICPVASLQGTPHDVKPWWGYGSQWNLLNYPAGVLPAGKVLKTDAYPEGYEPVNELDRENMSICEFPATSTYSTQITRLGVQYRLIVLTAVLVNVDFYKDLPVAIQIVGPTHEDEKVIGAMSVIDKIIHE